MATPQDLLNANANLATLDAVVTSAAETVPDRLGQQKLTLSGFEDRANDAIAATGYFPAAGSFEAGGTITDRNQYLQLITTSGGNVAGAYTWGGPLPKVVSAGNTPASTGGTSPNTWVYRSDATLRSNLAATDSDVSIAGVEAQELVARTKVVASLKQLRRVSGVTQPFESLVSGSGFGGGDAIFYPDMSETLHTGGTVWAAAAVDAWNGTQADLPTLLNYAGTGNGCYVRTNAYDWDKLTPYDFGYVDGGVSATLSMNKYREVARALSANFVETSVGGVNVETNVFKEIFKSIAAIFGRFAPQAFRTQYTGDGVQVPGPSGASVSSNMSSLELNQNTYTGGNSEPIHLISRVYGACPHAGSVFDLQMYGGSGQFGSEHVLRDGNIVSTAVISAINSSSITLATSSTSQYFGASINTRSGVNRGYPLLNETRKISTTATRVGRVFTVPSTTGMQVGYYCGFDADTVLGYPIGTGRHLSRIKEIWSSTQFLIDNELEASSSYETEYQGASTSGALTVFPATLPSGYNPITRTFSFNAALNSTINPVFQVGDSVVQYPSTDLHMVGSQIDMERTATQRVPRDIGQAILNNGKKAYAGTYVAGSPTGPVYAYDYGQYFNNVSVARYLFSFPQYETDNIAGIKAYHRNQAPTVLGADGLKGSTFHRPDGTADRTQYVNIDDGENYEPVQWVKQSGYSAVAMEVTITKGFRLYVNELGFSAEWDDIKWTFMRKRVIGTTAQRPTSVWNEFAYYDTTINAVVVWNGTAWV